MHLAIYPAKMVDIPVIVELKVSLDIKPGKGASGLFPSILNKTYS